MLVCASSDMVRAAPAEPAASAVALTGVALLGWIWARLEGSRRSRPSTTYSRACPKSPESAEVTIPASVQPRLTPTLASTNPMCYGGPSAIHTYYHARQIHHFRGLRRSGLV